MKIRNDIFRFTTSYSLLFFQITRFLIPPSVTLFPPSLLPSLLVPPLWFILDLPLEFEFRLLMLFPNRSHKNVQRRHLGLLDELELKREVHEVLEAAAISEENREKG